MRVFRSIPPRALMSVLVFLTLGILVALWQIRQQPAVIPLVPEKLTIAIADAFFVIPPLVAEDQGFFRDAGLDVTYRHFPSGKKGIEAMLNEGGIDVVTASDTPVALSALRKSDVTFIGSYTVAGSEIKVITHPDSGIKGVVDLRGRRVGVPVGTIAEFCFYVMLSDEGLAMSDIVKVPMAATEQADALGSHQVDAVATYEPYGLYARAITKDKGVVLTSNGRCVATTGYITSHALPKQRQEAVVRLLRGTERTIEWIRTHRAEAIAVVARKLKVDVQTVEALWDSYNFSLRLDQPFLNSLDQQAKWAVDSGLVTPTPLPNMLDYVDWSALAIVKPNAVHVIR